MQEPMLTETNEVVQRLKQILVRDLRIDITPEGIPDDYSLLEDGLALDSIVIEELIAKIEDQFSMRFDDRILDSRLFRNLTVLAQFVAGERAAHGAAAASTARSLSS
jgi:acyl carrier protein